MSDPDIPIFHFLANIPLLRDAGKETVERIAENTQRVYAPKGQVLFKRGDECRGFWIVLYGQVKLSMISPQGQEKVIELIGPGRSFAEAIMFMDIPYAVGAQTLADSLLLHVAKDAVNTEIANNPAFSKRMIAGLSARLHGLVRDVEAYSTRSGAERFIGYLLRVGDETLSDAANSARIHLPATKAIIASRLNLTPEHFSRVIHDLEAAGLISIEGRYIVVPDIRRLREFQG